ncbi:MAG: peptidyl-alpha-hydroxyglycine alpha-amidating lyase family protein [Chthoniobacteraceae bacterium]
MKHHHSLVVAVCFVLLVPPARAQSKYPKINLAAGYQVDPAWPQKPADIKWRYVTGVTVDKQDRVWILNAIAPHVQVYSSEGALLDSWGHAGFKNPHFLRIDPEGNLWAADYGAHVVMKFTPKGELLLTLGTPGVAGADETHFNRPTDIAITPKGELFVTDGYGNNRVVHFDATGKFIKSWGELGVGAGQLSQPHSIAVDSRGLIYVAERNNCRIQVFDQNGKALAQWRNLINPWGLWITPKDEIIVCGSSPARWLAERGNLGNPPTNQLLIKFDTTGRALELWTFPLSQPGTQIAGSLDWGHGLGVDSKGNLYIGDVADESLTHRVQKFLRLPAEK